MRSLSFLRTQLRLRKYRERLRLEALGREPSIETDPFDYYDRHRSLQRIGELEREIAEIESRSS